MKKAKTVAPFSFREESKQEVVDLLNQDYPVNLKYNEDLINRIHQKYPIISKTDVALIVKAAFQGIRDLLVLGKVLNFNTLFFDAKLHFFQYRQRGNILPSLKVKISTPPPMRTNDKY